MTDPVLTPEALDTQPWVGADQSRRARYSPFAPRFAPREGYSQNPTDYMPTGIEEES